MEFFARRLRNDSYSGLKDIFIFCKFKSSLSSAEQFLKCLIKFSLDITEFLGKLFSHSFIQFQNNSFQRFLSLNDIIVLTGQECMTFQKLFIIFNRIYINRTKFTDLILYACNIRFDCLSVGKFFFSILKCIVWRDLIFFPHIGNLTFPLLLNFFCLTSQTEAFFIQKRSLF